MKASGKSVVYVDESGFRDESHRRYGYAPKGEKVFGLISSQRTRTTTLIAARFEDAFTAARVFKGSCKAVDFNDWLAEQLCPRLTSKQVVILDNARLHKTPRTRQLIEDSGASLMFLPPYSPDYNPIEHDFANIKRHREYNSDMTLNDIIQLYQELWDLPYKPSQSISRSVVHEPLGDASPRTPYIWLSPLSFPLRGSILALHYITSSASAASPAHQFQPPYPLAACEHTLQQQ